MDTRVIIRVDENEKKQLDSILNELGLNLSAATNIFYKAVIRKRGLPFDMFLSNQATVSTAAKHKIIDEMAGVLPTDTDLDEARMERLL